MAENRNDSSWEFTAGQLQPQLSAESNARSHGMIENKPGGALSLVPWKRERWLKGGKMTKKKAEAATQENGKRPAFPNQ